MKPAVAFDGFEDRTSIERTDILDMFRANPRSRHPALLVRNDGTEDSVTITEFTQTGFRLSVEASPELGEDVHIRLAGQLDVPGKIRWAYGAEAGGSF
jgi:hypothetical protein